jgi:hypothetical protein
MAKIIKTEDNLLEFSDGTRITCDHEPDCCEYNYADFEQLDDLARGYDFNTSKLRFESVEGSGFRFGDHPQRMFFVPCYSDQNGYYSDMIEVYLNGEVQTSLCCEERCC